LRWTGHRNHMPGRHPRRAMARLARPACRGARRRMPTYPCWNSLGGRDTGPITPITRHPSGVWGRSRPGTDGAVPHWPTPRSWADYTINLPATAFHAQARLASAVPGGFVGAMEKLWGANHYNDSGLLAPASHALCPTARRVFSASTRHEDGAHQCELVDLVTIWLVWQLLFSLSFRVWCMAAEGDRVLRTFPALELWTREGRQRDNESARTPMRIASDSRTPRSP